MKKPVILCALFLVVCGLASADPATRLRADAEWMCQAVVKVDADAIVQHTYPGLVEKIGGPAAMKDVVVAGQAELEKSGLKVVSNEITSISEPVQAGAELHAVVRTKRVVRGRTGRQVLHSYVIAVSRDEGENWTFVDGQKLKPQHVMALFPDFNVDLVLPGPSEPVFERDTN